MVMADSRQELTIIGILGDVSPDRTTNIIDTSSKPLPFSPALHQKRGVVRYGFEWSIKAQEMFGKRLIISHMERPKYLQNT